MKRICGDRHSFPARSVIVCGGGLIPERGDVRKARKTCKIRTDLKTKSERFTYL